MEFSIGRPFILDTGRGEIGVDIVGGLLVAARHTTVMADVRSLPAHVVSLLPERGEIVVDEWLLQDGDAVEVRGYPESRVAAEARSVGRQPPERVTLVGNEEVPITICPLRLAGPAQLGEPTGRALELHEIPTSPTSPKG